MASTGTSGRVLHDDGSVAFVKSGALPGLLAVEARGLRALAAAGARVPEVLRAEDDRLEIEWIEDAGRATPQTEAAFGRELAALHHESRLPEAEDDWFGAVDGPADAAGRAGSSGNGPAQAAGAEATGPERGKAWLGAAEIDLTPCPTWAESWVVRRVVPLAGQAAATGSAPARVRDLAGRLAELTDGFGPGSPATHPGAAVLGGAEPSSLVHGDLWAGNRLIDGQGRSWLIDPCAHRGHREVDLAMMDLFGGFGRQAWEAYDDVFPLAEGWQDRVLAYQAVPLLVHAVLFGGGYGRQAEASLEHAVRLGG